MLGAIAGDIIGSVFESNRQWMAARTPHFQPLFAPECRFTDDTVLTVAIADALLHGGDLVAVLKDYCHRYPKAGYGGTFLQWAASPSTRPYGSWGNGSAMRVSPVGWMFDALDEVLVRARETASVTHDHPEGIKGAQATALSIYLARNGADKAEIRDQIMRRFGYDLCSTIDEIRPGYTFSASCQDTVPQAIIAFLESTDYESAVRLAISLGGDCDTLACIAGSIAAAAYGGVPGPIREEALARLDAPLAGVLAEFEAKFPRAAAIPDLG